MKKFMKKAWKVLKRIGDWFVFLVGGKGTITDECVNLDLCDFSGQGRDRYGR